jgi:hypothetical protein
MLISYIQRFCRYWLLSWLVILLLDIDLVLMVVFSVAVSYHVCCAVDIRGFGRSLRNRKRYYNVQKSVLSVHSTNQSTKKAVQCVTISLYEKGVNKSATTSGIQEKRSTASTVANVSKKLAGK